MKKTTQFSDIEHQKENIKQLSQGRKASALASLYKEESKSSSSIEQRYALQLNLSNQQNILDPLQPFITFIEFLQSTYPSGHPEIMKQVESATRQFRKDERYKNDKRYLELWMKVCEITKEPIEVFKYLAINKIGEKCAVFYEQYASLLEYKNLLKEADEVYSMGIEKRADPVDKLERVYASFKARTGEMGYIKQVTAKTAVKQHGSIKVYSDKEEDLKIKVFPGSEEVWDEFGTNVEARKENRKLVETMAGSKLLQKKTVKSNVAAVEDGFSVFTDNPAPRTKVEVKELLICNLSLVYIGEDEFCFEEIRALRLGYLLDEDDEMDIEPEILPKRIPLSQKVLAKSATVKKGVVPVIVPSKACNSPTINTKAAMKDVFSMFNQPVGEQHEVEEDETISTKLFHKRDTQKLNIFSDAASSYKGKLQQFRTCLIHQDQEEESTQYGRQLNRAPRAYTLMTPIIEHDNEQERELSHLFSGLSSIRTNKSYDNTLSEKSIIDHTFARLNTQISNSTPKKHIFTRQSTPAKANTSHMDSDSETDNFDNPCDPRSPAVVSEILSSILPYLKSLPSLIDCRHDNFNLDLKDLPVDLVQKNDPNTYIVQKRIGSGVNADVYLIVDESQEPEEEFAFKLQHSASPWEFYILTQILERCPHVSLAKSFECHVYKDKVGMRLDYHSQGTILDFNNERSMTDQSEELLALFWGIELIKCIHQSHKNGILHCDIKPDNILIRSTSNEISKEYCSEGKNGWSERGICLCDWGSAVDLHVFSNLQRFKSLHVGLGERTECWELRNQKEWKYNVDWYGLAGVIHVVLFGSYMRVEQDDSFINYWGDAKIESEGIPHLRVSGFKRYWNYMLWEELFDVLLNSGVYNGFMMDHSELIALYDFTNLILIDRDSQSQSINAFGIVFPLIYKIKSICKKMEDYLTLNCVKGGKNLRSILNNIDVKAFERNN